MAQAARLNLRLQKELKLLLTDPPYGASFPNLSTSSSLTTIDAQIKGPEGTVYSDGLFNIKIQIPDRYPFQPPSVTFATPIYHPNIDTGGRICLDILNLPPKGAWQPSLNISTVLTSIGLLLSEPNPDDGLMCEASREFKYNRQAFDQKAQSMTEKYARSSVHSLANPSTVQLGVETVNHESKHQENESVVKLEGELTNGDVKHDLNKSLVHKKKLFGNSKKLSLVSSVSSHKRDAHKEGCEVQSASEKLIKDEPNRCSQSQEKLGGSKRKLSLGALSQSQNKSDINMVDTAPNYCPSVEPQNLPVQFSGSMVPLSGDSSKQGFHVGRDGTSVADNIKMRSKRLCQSWTKQSFGSLDTPEMISENSDEMIVIPQIPPSQSRTKELSEPLPVVPDVNSVKRQPHKDVNGLGNGSTDTSRKRLCLGGKKLSLGLRGSSQMAGKDNKENVVPPQVSEHCGSSSKNGGEIATHKISGIVQPEGSNSNVHPHSKSLPKQHQDFSRAEKQQTDKKCIATSGTVKQKKAEEPASFQSVGVIVLDSEDSEEEKTAPAKSKPVIARKRLGKWRVRT